MDLIDSNVSLEEFVLINNVLNEYKEMKKEIKSSNSIKWIFISLK